VSFKVQEGEVVGMVGETGCGKSVTARSSSASFLLLRPESGAAKFISWAETSSPFPHPKESF